MTKLDKPAYGTPCNGCGACCVTALCPLGVHVLGAQPGPCPALEDAGPMFGCGLVAHPERYAPVLAARHGREALQQAAAYLVGVGSGCDARLASEPENLAFKRGIQRKAQEEWIAAAIAKKHMGCIMSVQEAAGYIVVGLVILALLVLVATMPMCPTGSSPVFNGQWECSYGEN